MAKANQNTPETTETETETDENAQKSVQENLSYVMRVKAIQADSLRRVMTKKGVVIARAGDYIVSYPDGTQSVFSQPNFESQFTKEKGDING